MLSLLFKKYFTYVSMAQSLALNIIGGLIFSPLFVIGVNIVSDCKVILIIIFGFIVGNGIMYLLCKGIRRAPLEFVDEKQCLKQGIKVIVIFLCAVCSLELFLLLLAFIVAFKLAGM